MLFEELASHTPLSPVRTSQRLDPVYDALWSEGTHASWLARTQAVRRVAAGVGRLPSHLQATPQDAWARFTSGYRWQQKLSALGVVDTWRTVTAEQLAALSGFTPLSSGRHSSLSDLFAMDLLEVGVFADVMRSGPNTRRATLYRPARVGLATDRLNAELTYPEWVSVTSGLGFEFARQFDRHNLIATELGLRVAEFCRVGTVLGEKLSSVDALAYTGWGVTPSTADSQRAADLTIVRKDGLRIAVEITASQGKTLDAKIARWAALLARRRFADSGLVVLFVVAGRPESSNHTTAAVMKSVRHNISTAARLHPGPATDRTADRMMVVSWSDWFPERGQATDGFVPLRVVRATGSAENPWKPVDLLNESQLPFTPAGTEALAVLDNASALRSVPWWLRNTEPPELWRGSVERAGFARLPQLVGLTDKGRPRVDVMQARGASGAPTVPRRLRG